MEVKDYPLDEIVAAVDAKLAEHPNWQFFQKFTCTGCGQRLTMDEPNTFFSTGNCDRCAAVTDIRARGCNYLVVMSNARARVV
jgi:predicted RNA-binding Zn-ribbon protein involved in translation (DUF1610 family)